MYKKNAFSLRRRSLIKGAAAAGIMAGFAQPFSWVYAREKTPRPAKESLMISVGAEPEAGFDPCTGWGFNGYRLFQSALLDFDANINLITDLATGYQVADSGLTYTYTLRRDVLFSDGTPLTAADVVFTYQTAKNSGSVVDLTMLRGVEALDSHTVVFTLNKPWSTFVTLTAQLGIVPAKRYHAGRYREEPVGSGPFQLVQWDKGQQIIIEPNPHYYGVPSPFKKITLLFLDEETALANAKSGQLDVVMVNPEYAKESVAGMQLLTVRTVDNRGFNLPVIPSGSDKSGKPIGNDVLCDHNIRKAMNIGIDRQWIINNALNGIGTPAFSRVDQLPWSNAATHFKDNRVIEANALLDAAGWQRDSDGVRVKNGLRAEITFNARTDDLQRYNLALALAENVRELGILLHAQARPWSECKEKAAYEPCCWGFGDYNPQDLYSGYHSQGSYNFSHYANPVVDAWIDKALASTDHAKAIEEWQLCQWDGKTGPDGEQGDMPFLWLVNIDHTYFVADGLKLGNQRLHPHGHGWPVVGNLQYWTWDA